MSNVTPWFTTELSEYPNKNRAGLYEALYSFQSLTGDWKHKEWYVWWDGRNFGQMRKTKDDAQRFITSKVRRPIIWRGLREKA